MSESALITIFAIAVWIVYHHFTHSFQMQRLWDRLSSIQTDVETSCRKVRVLETNQGVQTHQSQEIAEEE
jgi:hypothetical protein